MIAGGLALGLWALMNSPFGAQASSPPAEAASQGGMAGDESETGIDAQQRQPAGRGEPRKHREQ